MANNALKTMLKTDLIEMIQNGISNSNEYYLFVSRAIPYEDNATTTTVVESDTTIPSIGESSRNVYDTQRNMLFLKRIRPENLKLVVPRIDWTYGTVYTAYSETTDMAGENYYAMTSDYNVYKCMKSSGASEIMPTGKSADVISLGDGYKWKYIYTVPEDYLGHLTLDYIPVFIGDENFPEQKQVQDSALPGSIDTVTINATLSPTFDKVYRTDRFFANNNAAMLADLGVAANVKGSSYVSFDVVGEQSNPANGFWNNYAIYVTKGPGIGQYFRIIDFKKGGGAGGSYFYANVYPNLSRDIVTPEVGADLASKFKIVPYIAVDGDGINAVVIPNTSNAKKIASLSLVNPGYYYTYAQPRIVSESTSAGLSASIALLNASISTSLSTPRGHGADAIREFGAADMMMVTEVDGTEGGKISTRNDYRQFGIIKSPYLYGGITLAGAEEEISLKALIKKQPTKSDQYSLSTFVPGNYIIGKETRATARILDNEIIPGSRFHRLYLTDVVGNFRFAEDASINTRIYYASGFTGTFATGDVATQFQALDGWTLSAYGTILSVNSSDRNFVVETTYGAFTSGKNISFVAGTTLTAANVLEVDDDFGELLGQVSLGFTGSSQFITFGGDEVFGRLASTSFVPTVVENLGEYSAITKMKIVSSSGNFTDKVLLGSNPLDGTISQTDSTTLKKTTAKVVDFVVDGGSGLTGMLHLSNLTGTFNTTDQLRYQPYGLVLDFPLTTTTVNTIYNPDIEVGSGDLLYIENVRPIDRNIEQSEEFKIVIGF